MDDEPHIFWNPKWGDTFSRPPVKTLDKAKKAKPRRSKPVKRKSRS